jgi:hypothetical protein
MARTCKGICLRIHDVFTTKQLSYDEGSYCRRCEVWIKQATNSKLDAAFVLDPYKKPPSGANIAIVIEPNGKQVMLWLVPVLVKKVICKCCRTQARGKTHHSPNNRLRNKIFNTFKQKVDRAPRGVSEKTIRKKEERSRQQDNIDYDGEESVFDHRGMELED